MNQHDVENIRFLLSRTPEQLREWYNSVSDEDLLYASLILENYADFLRQENITLEIERQIEQMPVLTEAQALIAAVRDLT